MQEKIHQILSEAKDFMTAEEMASKGKWRSTGNVKVALRQMTKAPGQIISRKSKTKAMLNGHPAEEFALAEKDFAKKHLEERAPEIPKAVDIDVPVVRKTRTTEPKMPTDKECCNAAKVVATTAAASSRSIQPHGRIATATVTAWPRVSRSSWKAVQHEMAMGSPSSNCRIHHSRNRVFYLVRPADLLDDHERRCSMKIKVEQLAFANDQRNVKIKVSEKSKWIDFGAMNYTERAELAAQLRQMANELLKVN